MRLQIKPFFGIIKSILIAAIACFAHSTIFAQDSIKPVLLTFKTPLRLEHVPFDKVQVLDNRMDTTKFFTYQTGRYPVVSLGFGENAADSIARYMEQAIKSRPNSDGSILINIKQLRVCNRPYISKKAGTKSFNFRMRDYTSLTADIFYKSDANVYKKLISIDKVYYTPDENYVIKELPLICNDLLVLAAIAQDSSSLISDGKKKSKNQKRLQREVAYFKRVSTPATMTVEEIDINTKSSWAKFPIVSDSVRGNGIYLNFDDFRDNKPVAAHFKISYNTKDSLYEVADIKFDTTKKRRAFYAVCDSGNLYVPITNDRYQKMERFEHTFGFSIPRNLPDSYSLFSLINYPRGGGVGGASGNVLIDLAALAVSMAVDGIITDSANKKITKKGLQSQQYRHCFIDMDSGDFIY